MSGLQSNSRVYSQDGSASNARNTTNRNQFSRRSSLSWTAGLTTPLVMPSTEVQDESKIQVGSRTVNRLVSMSSNPFVPRKQRAKTWLASGLAFIVTVGNALSNAGQAFFSIVQRLSPFYGVIAATSTFVAMADLYGASVFGDFQKKCTNQAEREEYMALIKLLAQAKALGFYDKEHLSDFRLELFLREQFENRFDKLLRAKFRECLFRAETNNIDLKLAYSTAYSVVLNMFSGFKNMLIEHFGSSSAEELAETKRFFNSIYNLPSIKEDSIPKVDYFVFSSLLKGKSNFDLDLEPAFTEISVYLQWLYTMQLRGKRLKKGAENEETETFKAEKQKRLKRLKKALRVSTSGEIWFGEISMSWELAILKAEKSASLATNKQAALFFPETKNSDQARNFQQKRKDFIRFSHQMAEDAYNTAFSTPMQKWFVILGQLIGFLCAAGNATLGYVGLTTLLTLIGLSAIPAVFIPLLILGMLTTFGSSFFMTRFAIVGRFEELGRWLSKGLPIEKQGLRYISVLLGAIGAVAPASFAFNAGKALMISLVGANPAAMVGVFAFALTCSIATFCGAGALMVQSVYRELEPYVWLVKDSKDKTAYARFILILRMFFLGQIEPIRSSSDAVRLMLGRLLGLLLLAGTIASQIELGFTPYLLVFSGICMWALYGGVFGVSQKLVNAVFAGMNWLGKQPNYGFKIMGGLCSIAVLYFIGVSISSLVMGTTVLGITTAIAPALIAPMLLLPIISAAIYYIANKHYKPNKELGDEEIELLSFGDSIQKSDALRQMPANAAAVQGAALGVGSSSGPPAASVVVKV